jgi:hypothetical protein
MDPPYLNMETLRSFYVSARHLARGAVVPREGQADAELTRCIVITCKLVTILRRHHG